MRRRVALTVCIAAASCRGSDHTYTLYRSSLANDSLRIHVASFDTPDGEIYNRDNCEAARALFQKQPNVRTRFWCEKGAYRH